MTYSYECQNSDCRAEWEQQQKITEAPITECPLCGSHSAKRLISGPSAFSLKGSGWYRDGYAG